MKIEIGKSIKKTIMIDDVDFFKIAKFDLYFSEIYGFKVRDENGKFKLLRYLIAGVDSSKDCTLFVLHKNKDRYDFRKSNLITKTKVDVVSERDYRYAEKQTRGASYYNHKWYCIKTYNHTRYIIKCTTEQEALEQFDALSDFTGSTGPRNFPGSVFTLKKDLVNTYNVGRGLCNVNSAKQS